MSGNLTKYSIPDEIVTKLAKTFHDCWWPNNLMSINEQHRYETATRKVLTEFLDAANEF